MRDIGKTAATMATAGMMVGLVGCGQGPQSEHVGDAVAYVIVDRSAREAGVQIDGVSASAAVLPVELSASSRQELVGPSGRVKLELHPDEVVYVRGREARLQRGMLDTDVARDRVSVLGSESAARALADEVGGVVDTHEGRFVVVGPEALGGFARAATPEGLDEIEPVMPGDAAGKAAFASFESTLPASEREILRQPVAAGKPFDLSAFVTSRIAEPADDLLPAAVECADPVVGTWVSREHYPDFFDWYRFELTIRRDAREPGRLIGTIGSRSWAGGPDRSLPTSCLGEESPDFDWTVRMSAIGSFDGNAVSLDGRGLSVEGTRCGPTFQGTHYNMDHFSGQLVQGGRFLQAVNNDGDRAVDEPHVFRRISCH